MASYYIYLPVNDPQLVNVAREWKKHADDQEKSVEVIVRQSTGFRKWVSRKVRGGVLRNVDATATVYLLAHGFSEGKTVTGPEAEARSLLSTYGDNYPYLRQHYPKACDAVEEAKYARSEDGSGALEDALEDDRSYEAVVELFAKYMGEGTMRITLERPGAIKVGGTRPDGSTKVYSPAELFRNLKQEGLPKVPRLKIFACNTGIVGDNGTKSFTEHLYDLMKNDYPHTRVFGYLGAVNAGYGPRNNARNGKIPKNSSQLWQRFHDSEGGYTDKDHKGVRIVRPTLKGVLMWGSEDAEQIPAHVLRVEFPGGRSVAGGMWTQENAAKPF